MALVSNAHSFSNRNMARRDAFASQQQLLAVKTDPQWCSERMGVDDELRATLSAINAHRDVATWSSCAGHVRVCRRDRAMQTRAVDDLDLHVWLARRGAAPYLTFSCTARMAPFVDRLRRASARHGWYLNVDATDAFGLTSYTFGVFDSEDMNVATIDAWHRNGKTTYRRFWRAVAKAWRTCEPDQDLPLPKRFGYERRRWYACQHCRRDDTAVSTMASDQTRYDERVCNTGIEDIVTRYDLSV